MREVAARMAVLAGVQVLPTRAYLLDAWQSGRISQADLMWALALKAASHSGVDATAVHRRPGAALEFAALAPC